MEQVCALRRAHSPFFERPDLVARLGSARKHLQSGTNWCSISIVARACTRFLGNIACIPESEAQHFKELNAIFENRLVVVVDEEIMVNARDPKAVPLGKSKLIAKCAGAYLNLASAKFSKEVNDSFQESSAIAGSLMV